MSSLENNVLPYRKPLNTIELSADAVANRNQYAKLFGEAAIDDALRYAKKQLRYEDQTPYLHVGRRKMGYVIPRHHGPVSDRLLTLYMVVAKSQITITAILLS